MMFRRTKVWFLVLLCVHGGTSREDVYSKDNHELEKEFKTVNKFKRGIALVDEDFDVPPGSNTVQEYDGGIFDEERPGNSLEGSGEGITEQWGEETTKSLISSTRPQFESEFFNVTNNKTTAITQPLKVTEYSTGKTSSKSTFIAEISDTTLVSSGDGIIQTQEQSTTEMITSIDTKQEDTFENLPDTCLNTTCDKFELSIQPLEVSLIPEGINLTLTCRSNFSDHHILYWYKSNGSTYLLQTIETDQGLLQLSVADARTSHSGKYKCVLWMHEEFCCNTEFNLTVYEIPHYKYYLITLGLIAATGLLICIVLSVQQSKSLKIYTKEFAKKHGKAEEQLLWN